MEETGSDVTEATGSSLTVDGLSRASHVTLWLSHVRPRNLMYRGAGAGAGAGAGRGCGGGESPSLTSLNTTIQLA